MLSLHSVLAMVYGMCTSEGSLAYCSVLGFGLNAEIQRTLRCYWSNVLAIA